MIDEKEILKELDERIELQGIIVEHSYTGNRSGNAVYEQGRFDEIKALRDFIKTKSAQEAATSKGTDINSLTQKQYNTDQEKIEPIKLAQEIFALCMKIQEGEDRKVEQRMEHGCSGPAVFFEFYGHVAKLDVAISPEGWTEEKGRKEYFSFYLGELWDQQEEKQAIKCKERLIEILEERRGNNNEE